jgi:ribonuclease HI
VKALLHTDGGARGNPGPAAYGFVLEEAEGDVLACEGVAIGEATNNVAEYRGLVAGLARAIELGVTELEVRSDSQLMVRQMRGEYRIKKESLRELAEEAAGLARALARVTYVHVTRDRNELADRLVNDALDGV